MANAGNTTATNGASTEILDAGSSFYQTISLENQGSSTVWFSWGEDAALNQGISLAPTGTDGSAIIIPMAQGNFPGKLNAWADGSNCNIAWHIFMH